MRASAESSHRLLFIVARRRGAYVGGHHGISLRHQPGQARARGWKNGRGGAVLPDNSVFHPPNRNGMIAMELDAACR